MRSSIPTQHVSSQQEAQQRAYVEFGAGKGYLGLALVDTAPGAALVLVDKGTFRLPADRRACCFHTCCLCITPGIRTSSASSGGATPSMSSRIACPAEQCGSQQNRLMLTCP